jgi:glycosyltransferase involved in cell wall biosynthesis
MARGDSQLQTARNRLKIAVKEIAYPLALRAFDAALYVGENSRRYWEHYHYPRERMFFSPHCVDNHWFTAGATAEARARLRQSCGIAEDVFVVLFAGKLVPFKRPLDIVEAVARCRTAGGRVEMMVAGSGVLDGAVRDHAARRKVPIHMLGFCNQSRMPAAYAAADALALASNSAETWGLVVNEALACGRPAIVSDACGCAYDLAADGTAGAVFHCGDIADLAQSMRRLIDQPPSRDAIAAKAKRYNIDTAVNGIVEAMSAFQPSERRRTRRG